MRREMSRELREARRIARAFGPAALARVSREAVEMFATGLFLAGLFAFVFGLAG